MMIDDCHSSVYCRLELLEEGEKQRARNIVSGCLVFQRTMGRLKQKSITLVKVGHTLSYCCSCCGESKMFYTLVIYKPKTRRLLNLRGTLGTLY